MKTELYTNAVEPETKNQPHKTEMTSISDEKRKSPESVFHTTRWSSSGREVETNLKEKRTSPETVFHHPTRWNSSGGEADMVEDHYDMDDNEHSEDIDIDGDDFPPDHSEDDIGETHPRLPNSLCVLPHSTSSSSTASIFSCRYSEANANSQANSTCPTHTIDAILGLRSLQQQHEEQHRNTLLGGQNFVRGGGLLGCNFGSEVVGSLEACKRLNGPNLSPQQQEEQQQHTATASQRKSTEAATTLLRPDSPGDTADDMTQMHGKISIINTIIIFIISPLLLLSFSSL